MKSQHAAGGDLFTFEETENGNWDAFECSYLHAKSIVQQIIRLNKTCYTIIIEFFWLTMNKKGVRRKFYFKRFKTHFKLGHDILVEFVQYL